MSTPERFNRTWASVAGGLTIATGLVHDAMAVLSLAPWWATRGAASRPMPACSVSREAGAA